MHFGQIGLEQTWHFSVTNWSGCLEQRCGSLEASGSASAEAASGVWMRIRATGRDWGADWTGAATCSGAGAGATPADPDRPSSCRTRLLTKSEVSSPPGEK